MNNLKWICLLLITVGFVDSCKKNSPQPPVVYPNYSQLATGNYWIYERFNIDASGNATAAGIFDSCYIEKDTLINGHTYYKQIRAAYGLPGENSYVRDSLHYLINHTGFILFSSQNFADTFYRYANTAGPGDTVCVNIQKMADKDFPVTTPAGQYLTSSLEQAYYFYPNWAGAGNPRYMNTRYADNVGIVTETLPFYSSNPNYVERRLVRFHVN